MSFYVRRSIRSLFVVVFVSHYYILQPLDFLRRQTSNLGKEFAP